MGIKNNLNNIFLIGFSGSGKSKIGKILSRSLSYKFIDTTINVTGVTTGYSIDIPIRILKGTTFSS